LLRSLEGHQTAVISVAFSPDGTRLVSASTEHRTTNGDVPAELRVWDLGGDGKVRGVAAPPGNLRDVAFNEDGTALVIVADDRSARFDLATGRWSDLPGRPDRRLRRAHVSPDGARVLRIRENVVEIRALQPSDEELAARRALADPDPRWHAWEAARAAERGQPLAAEFHRKRATLPFR
jgi:WD40 repeat protein